MCSSDLANGGANQKWTLDLAGGDLYTLVNVNSGKCLGVPSASATEGVQLEQLTCDGSASQEWAAEAVGNYQSSSDSSFVLASLNSGLLAEVEGSSTAEGAAVDQWAANGGANQTWTIG